MPTMVTWAVALKPTIYAAHCGGLATADPRAMPNIRSQIAHRIPSSATMPERKKSPALNSIQAGFGLMPNRAPGREKPNQMGITEKTGTLPTKRGETKVPGNLLATISPMRAGKLPGKLPRHLPAIKPDARFFAFRIETTLLKMAFLFCFFPAWSELEIDVYHGG